MGLPLQLHADIVHSTHPAAHRDPAYRRRHPQPATFSPHNLVAMNKEPLVIFSAKQFTDFAAAAIVLVVTDSGLALSSQ